MSRSLVKGVVQGELNEDREDAILEDGGEGWTARGIVALAAAGATVGVAGRDRTEYGMDSLEEKRVWKKVTLTSAATMVGRQFILLRETAAPTPSKYCWNTK
jgi:hypothetical protein